MGSGTTAVSARNLNRQFIGFETKEDYYEKSLLRLEEIESIKIFKLSNKKRIQKNKTLFDIYDEKINSSYNLL